MLLSQKRASTCASQYLRLRSLFLFYEIAAKREHWPFTCPCWACVRLPVPAGRASRVAKLRPEFPSRRPLAIASIRWSHPLINCQSSFPPSDLSAVVFLIKREYSCRNPGHPQRKRLPQHRIAHIVCTPVCERRCVQLRWLMTDGPLN